ncbi:MAG: ABC transporter substrate-binding protein [Desulfovibrio sp.]
MKKFLFLLVALAIAVPAYAADGPVFSISQIVEHPSLDAVQNGFKDRMKELAPTASFNVHIAQGNPATNTQIANQMLGEQPNVVVAITTPSAQAVAQKIKDLPVVFTAVSDPVAAGLVKALDTPGDNITGMTDMSPMDKHLALVKRFVPEMKSLGTIYNAGESNSIVMTNALEEECKKSGITLERATVANSSGVYQAAKSLVGRCDAIFIPLDNTVVSVLESVIKVCEQNQLPLLTFDTDSVARGSIAGMAMDYYKMGQQTADIAFRIYKGASPKDIPVETIKQLELVINLKAAKAMGVTVPDDLMTSADKIIR